MSKIRTMVLTKEEKSEVENNDDFFQETIFRLLKIANDEGKDGLTLEGFELTASGILSRDDIFKLYFK